MRTMDHITICPQTNFVVMSMSGGGDGGRETRMDSTLPTVDANGKESADNDTNRDLAGPPNNVITRSNGNTTSQLPLRPRQFSQSSPTATDFLPGAAADTSQQPQGILPWPTGRTNICEIAATSGPPPDRASIDDTPISPTSNNSASREPPVRPTVRLPSQTSAQARSNNRSNVDDETAISPTSTAAPQTQAMIPPPSQTATAGNEDERSSDAFAAESAVNSSAQARSNNRSELDAEVAISPTSVAAPQTQAMLPPLSQTGTTFNEDDRSSDTIAPESAASSSTTLVEQEPEGTASPTREDAADGLLQSSNADSSSREQATTVDVQTRAIERRDFAAGLGPVNGEALAPPREPSIAPQERSDPGSGSGMSTLRMPQPAQRLLSSDSPSVPSSPARQVSNASRRRSVAPQAIENRQRPLMHHRHPSGGRSTPNLRDSGPPMQLSIRQQHWMRRERSNQFRDDSVYLAQRIRIKFAPPTPGARRIQDYFASLEHAAEAENRERHRRGLYMRAPNASEAQPALDPAQAHFRLSRHQEIAEYTWHSLQIEARMRERFESPEPPQQTRQKVEQAASVRHAAELERRLSIQFGDLDMPADNSGSSRRLSGTSSLPSRSISRQPDAQPFSPPPRMNGLRTRSESSAPSERIGRTPAPVIVDGRTPEQRQRYQLPDTNKFYPAVNGNPAGPHAPGTCSPNPVEGEAGPSTYSRQQSRTDSVPASFIIGSPGDAPSQDSDDEALELAQPTPDNKGKGKSPLRRTPSPRKEGEAGPSSKQAKSKSPSASLPILPHPFQPLDSQLSGNDRPQRTGAGPTRAVNPIAAVVPGDSNPMHPDTPPPPTALRDRRLDEHSRLIDHGLSDGEGSERVIASSSSEEGNRGIVERGEENERTGVEQRVGVDEEDGGSDFGLEKLFYL